MHFFSGSLEAQLKIDDRVSEVLVVQDAAP
jgi:hypothetical protein